MSNKTTPTALGDVGIEISKRGGSLVAEIRGVGREQMAVWLLSRGKTATGRMIAIEGADGWETRELWATTGGADATREELEEIETPMLEALDDFSAGDDADIAREAEQRAKEDELRRDIRRSQEHTASLQESLDILEGER